MDPFRMNMPPQPAFSGYSPPPGPPPPPSLSPTHHWPEMGDEQSPQSTDSRLPFNQQGNWNQGRPAPWQLGSHAQHGYYNGQPQITSNEAPEPVQASYGWSKEQYYDGSSIERVQIVNYSREPEPEDVELTLHRGLQARQLSMIALGGAIGIGLVIGSGTALRQGGPLGILIGYSFVGAVCFCVMISLGELSAYLPHKKGFAGYATRFWHPAFGFAMGWNYLMMWLFLCPNMINAARIVIEFWTDRIPPYAWMAAIIVCIVSVNCMGIRVFGELEFWFSSIKVITLTGLIIFGITMDLGGNPQRDRIGFRYWNPPSGPMGSYLLEVVQNVPLSRFLGFWSVMVNALYAYIGIELLGVTVGEAENPRRNIPIAVRRTFIRIIIFYVGGVFTIGLIVPRDADVFIGGSAEHKIAASPFLHAAIQMGVNGLDHVVNAALMVFIFSAANSQLYIASRTLYGLALLEQAPRIFRKVNRRGVPMPALAFCSCFSCLVFLNASSGPGKVFNYFVSVCVTFGAITWMCILYTHIRFMKGLEAQGISRLSLPYKAPFQPYAAWFGIVCTAIITFFKGFDSFIGPKGAPFKTDAFITAYIGLPVFGILFGFWKWRHGDRTVPYQKMDLMSGKEEIDQEEERYLAAQLLLGPRSKWRKIWDSL